MIPGTRNDGLRLQLSGSDVGGLRIIGTMPGCVVNAAAARNGPGQGLLISSPGSGLAWQAPGSTTPGAVVGTSGLTSGTAVMLEDGEDPSMWISLLVYPAYLPGTGQAAIAFEDLYNDVGPADVAAADALAGVITTTEYTLLNSSGAIITGALMWLDDTASGFAELAISQDGVNFYQPTSATDPNVLSWATIAAGATASVWVQRTISATSASSPGLLNILRWRWNGL